MKISDLDKKLLAGLRSPAKSLTETDFKRIRSLTINKVALAQRGRITANKPAP
jgi:hypothetical protein